MPKYIYIQKSRRTKVTGCDLISYLNKILAKHHNNSFHLAPVWEAKPIEPLQSEPYINVTLPTNWGVFIQDK